MSESAKHCEFCENDGGLVLYRDDLLRVVLTDEPFTGFCRIIWNQHIVEFSDLSQKERYHCADILSATESALRDLLAPVKMNLASLGNKVPHLHWHVIPRFPDDTHFPQPVWSKAQRSTAMRQLSQPFCAQLADAINAKAKEHSQQKR